MNTSYETLGGCANIREFLIAPVTAIYTPIENSYFSYPEIDENLAATGITLYHSVNSHMQYNTNRKALYTKDGMYFYYGMASSDLRNDTKDLKTFVKTAGLKLGADDFTSMVVDEFWVLNLSELEEWISVTPHNVVEEVL